MKALSVNPKTQYNPKSKFQLGTQIQRKILRLKLNKRELGMKSESERVKYLRFAATGSPDSIRLWKIRIGNRI